jgi:hypothetical protein
MREGVAELSRFSKSVPLPIQRDIAVALVAHDQVEYEPPAISLLMDASALGWKRANAASALGEHGTESVLPYLRQVASEPATTNSAAVSTAGLLFRSGSYTSPLTHKRCSNTASFRAVAITARFFPCIERHHMQFDVNVQERMFKD